MAAMLSAQLLNRTKSENQQVRNNNEKEPNPVHVRDPLAGVNTFSSSGSGTRQTRAPGKKRERESLGSPGPPPALRGPSCRSSVPPVGFLRSVGEKSRNRTGWWVPLAPVSD